MRQLICALLLAPTALASAQAPGAGWVMSPSPARVVKTLYWELFDTSEVWVRIEPTGRDGRPAPPLSLVFLALFPGKRLKQTPATIQVQAQPGPLTIVSGLTLTLSPEGGAPLDLTAPGQSFQTVSPCGAYAEPCSANAVIATVPWDAFSRFAASERADGNVLGFQVALQPADLEALRALEKRLIPR